MSIYDPPNLRLAQCCFTCLTWVGFCGTFRCTRFLGDRIASHVCDAWEPQLSEDNQKLRIEWDLERSSPNT